MKLYEPENPTDELKKIVEDSQSEPVVIRIDEGDTIAIKYTDFVNFLNKAVYGLDTHYGETTDAVQKFGLDMKDVIGQLANAIPEKK